MLNPSKRCFQTGMRAGAVLAACAILGVAFDPAEARRRSSGRPVTFSAPLPEPRPAITPEAAPAAPSPPQAPPPAAASVAPPEEAPDLAAACLRRLADLGVKFASAAAPASGVQCRIDNPVRLEAVETGGQIVRWPDRPLVSCEFATTLASFTRDVAQPLARGLAGASVTAFGTGNGFECRSRNGVAGARMSAHGQGLAVDIAWFEFAGGKRAVVEAPGDDDRRRFVDALRKAACGWFTTVLGPGSDSAHSNHLHLDRERRGRDGQSRLCQ